MRKVRSGPCVEAPSFTALDGRITRRDLRRIQTKIIRVNSRDSRAESHAIRGNWRNSCRVFRTKVTALLLFINPNWREREPRRSAFGAASRSACRWTGRRGDSSTRWQKTGCAVCLFSHLVGTRELPREFPSHDIRY
jgi:hypothetical protein